MARIKKNLQKSKSPELVESCQTCGKRLPSQKDGIIGWLFFPSSEQGCHCATSAANTTTGETETLPAIADQSKIAPDSEDNQPKLASAGQKQIVSPPRARSAPRNNALWLTVILLSLVAMFLVNSALRHPPLEKPKFEHNDQSQHIVSDSTSDAEIRDLITRARSISPGAFAGWRPADDFTPHSLRHAAEALVEAKQLPQAEKLYRRAYTLAAQSPKQYFWEGRPIPDGDNVKMAAVTYLPPLIGCLKKEGKSQEAASLKAHWESVVNELPFPPAARERWRLDAVKAWGNDSDRETQLKAVVDACEKDNKMTPSDFAEALRKNTEELRKVDSHGVTFGMISMPRGAYDIDRALEDLARWYEQHKEYAKEEEVLRKRADLQGRIYPPGAWVSRIWSEIAQCCDHQGKHHEATTAIRTTIDDLQAAGFDKNDFGGCLRSAYQDYARYLVQENKRDEANAASLRAEELQKVYR